MLYTVRTLSSEQCGGVLGGHGVSLTHCVVSFNYFFPIISIIHVVGRARDRHEYLQH